MKLKYLSLVTGLALATLTRVHGAEIIGDNYDTASNGSGFVLGEGINAGINPPVTRLTGSAAPNLRYIKASGDKNDSAHSVNAEGKFRINRSSSGSSTVTLSEGVGAYDFGTALNTLVLNPTNRAEYEIAITFANSAAGSQRCSFALSSVTGTANAWDFALQLYRPSTTDTAYTLMRRVSAAAGDLGGPLNADPIGTIGTFGEEVSFLIRVTDAGAEAVASTNSFIEVASIEAGVTNWIYDTRLDASLPTGWRFVGASRYIYWDAANNAGPVTFDNFSLNQISGPTTGTRIWTGQGADDNWSTGLNWGGIAPSIGDTLVFDGVTRQASFNDIPDLSVPRVEFNNGGFSISGPLTVANGLTNLSGINVLNGDLGFASTSVKSWGIANGSEITLNNTTTVEVGGDHTIVGGGTLRLKGAMNIGQLTTVTPAFVVNEGQHVVDAGTFISRGGYRIGSLDAGIGAQTILTNNATFSLTVSGANLRVGDSANPVASRLVIDNSTLTMTGSSMGIAYAAGATGEVVQNGGLVSGGIIAFNDAGAGTGTYSIKDGTLQPIQIREDTADGVSSIFFDNAILRPAVTTNAFFSGIDLAEIQAGGLTIDAQYDVSIDQNLSGTGSLTKSGFATVTLNGANTYAGNTIIQSGRLVYPNTLTNAAVVQVADSAELGVIVANPGATLSLASVNLGGGFSSTLHFDLSTYGKPTAPLLKVSNLSANGPVTINVANGLQLSTGQIVLVDYDGAIGGGFNFSLGTLPSGVIATLVNNVTNSSIDLNITGVPGLRWTGAVNGEWDYGTQNWIDLQTGTSAFYADNYPLEFPDSAANGVINIAGFPLPALVAVNNDTLPYVWSGGAITTPLLKKSGTNSLTRNEGAPDLITEIELNDGFYIANDSGDTVLASILSDTSAGDGTFVKQGASTLTLTGVSDTYDGDIVVQQGMLQMGDNSSLGTTNGGTTIASGATLDVNNFVAPHEPVIVSGEGYIPFGASAGLGAIIDSTTQTGVANNLTDVTMVGDTTFGAPNDGRWDIRMRSGTGPAPGLRGNGFNLTKVGPGTLSIAAQRHFGVDTPYWEMNLGDIFIKEGGLTFAESLGLGNPSKTITISPGATLSTYDLRNTNPIVRAIFMTDATITGGGGAGDTNIFTGAIQMTGANHLRPINTVLIIDGSLQGTGSLNVSATGVGMLQLNGINTFPGDTIVTNGTFGGNGVLAGNLVMLDGTLAPGTEVGTFTVNGSATLAGTTVMELNRSLSPNSDRLVAGGSLNFGGALTVVLAAGAPSPQAGDVYQLFNKGGAGTFAPINLPNLAALPGGLAWDISKLTVDGTITVTGTATPPTIGSVSFDGGNLVFSGTGGVEGGTYVVLSSPDIAEPIANWTPVATNVFGAGGSFSYTNSINPATPESFYLLQVP